MNDNETIKDIVKISTAKEFVKKFIELDDQGIICTDGYYSHFHKPLYDKAVGLQNAESEMKKILEITQRIRAKFDELRLNDGPDKLRSDAFQEALFIIQEVLTK